MSNVEGMYSVYFKKSVSEAIPSFDIRNSTFFGSAVRFLTLCSFIKPITLAWHTHGANQRHCLKAWSWEKPIYL